MKLASIAVLWTAVSTFVSPCIEGWLARRPAGLTSAGLGTMSDRGAAAPLDP